MTLKIEKDELGLVGLLDSTSVNKCTFSARFDWVNCVEIIRLYKFFKVGGCMSNLINFSSYNVRTQIRNIINEKYKEGFPIVKELIQNANDAKASDIYFLISDGIPDCKHPLLRIKSLIIINNGEFTQGDSKNILSMWSDDKSQENKIGKFGLGLKSVFHWCEAFFCYANIVKEKLT